MIPHSRPALGEEEKRACLEVFNSLQIAQGKKVEEFENDFCAWTGQKFAIAVNSGTSALYLSLLALEISKGDEVIVPSFNCAALLHAVEAAGAKPVPADIDAEDFNMGPEQIRPRIRKKTKAIIAAPLFGRAARMKEILKLGIPVIEDGTQVLGASEGNQKAGSFGEISLFSFYATKMITTGEGGMLLTDSKKLAAELRDLRDYDKKEKHRLRTNSKMTDFQAAMGIEQLSKLASFIEKRRAIAKHYDGVIREMGLEPPVENVQRPHVYFRYVVRNRKAKGWIQSLQEKGIDAKSPIFKPLHRYLNLSDRDFPETMKAWKQTVSIPIFPSMTDVECEKVCEGMTKADYVEI